MADKKQSACGCGCLPSTKKGSKSSKPQDKKSKNQKTSIVPSTDGGGRSDLSNPGRFSSLNQGYGMRTCSQESFSSKCRSEKVQNDMKSRNRSGSDRVSILKIIILFEVGQQGLESRSGTAKKPFDGFSTYISKSRHVCVGFWFCLIQIRLRILFSIP